ncbi:MAG TPA: hypothetical protein VFE51_04515 [Verrucomicrobiae bacterium]|nr:hypothetical protein [Verrucomicrobiae bacterium]
MRAKQGTAGALVGVCAALVLLAAVPAKGFAGEMKLEAQLVWGTDDSKPPEGKDYKPVEAAIQKKIKDLPLKWKNYFEVKRTEFKIAPAAATKIPISEKCSLTVQSHNDSVVEVSWIGKGREVLKRTQSLSKGEILILGGNAPNATAYLMVLRRIE